MYINLFAIDKMGFLDKSTKLSEIIEENHQLIPVINRFGIKLGLSDKNIEEICLKENINTDFFLVILNTFLNEDYFPERILQKVDISLIIDYINRTDVYIQSTQLYNLEKHLNAFIAMSDPNNKQLELIRRLFVKFKESIIKPSDKFAENGAQSLALLNDLKNIFIKHISGNFNENMAYAVVFTIDSFQKDLTKHYRIKDKILHPKINELKDSGIEDWQSLILSNNTAKTGTSHSISQRELDVLRLVAQGYLNKEIADKLNISLNTVLSHRKNITAKLGIKTVSGLIFYCISHGYISADEIEL